MYADNIKQELANQMACADALNELDDNATFDYHFQKLMGMRDFDLLQYWLEYNGVFDGGEDLLQYLKP